MFDYTTPLLSFTLIINEIEVKVFKQSAKKSVRH